MSNKKANETKQTSFQLASENKFDSKVDADSFWYTPDIDYTRWNKSFPYQLLVVWKDNMGYREDKAWKFTLPIPPEALHISTPAAVTLNLTLGGAVEEHGGAPLRNITLSGTCGVLPMRGSSESVRQFSFAQGIFAGTIQSAQNVASAALEVGADFSNGAAKKQPNLLKESDLKADSEIIGKTSGYYQILLMRNFIERYLQHKKTDAGADCYLALAIWKENAVYVVTPVNFDMEKAVPNVWEWKYNLTLRSYKRIQLEGPGPLSEPFKPIARDPNGFARTMKGIRDARRVLQNARRTISALGGDINKALFEPLREASLFCKDALGVGLALSDLPGNVVLGAKNAVLEFASTRRAFETFPSSFTGNINNAKKQAEEIEKLGSRLGLSDTKAGVTEFAQASSASQDPVNSIFKHPDEAFDLFDQIQLGDLNIPPSVMRGVVQARKQARAKTRADFEKMRDDVDQLSSDYADLVGAGNDTYNDTYARQEVTSTKTPTQDDYDVLFALNNVSMEFARLAASATINNFRLTTMEFFAGMASRSGIAFNVPRSKFVVPFMYGDTLEQMAQRYLGDANRWHEIAALNGLRAPFVDETGFDRALLTNGSGNQIVIEDGYNLFVGQPVWLNSYGTAAAKRRITKIERISSTQWTITVDGDNDLDRFRLAHYAFLHAFLPDTVNSLMSLYMPSDSEPGDQDHLLKAVPGVDQHDDLLRVGGIDLLLTSNNDLAITEDGDCRLAIGMANIIQKARIRLSLQRGQLLHHPEIGLAVRPGTNTADLSIPELFEATKNLFADDPTFSDITAVSISKRGSVMSMAIAASVAGVSHLIPIVVDIKS